MSICDNARNLAPSRLYAALKIFTIVASSICSCVLFVGLDRITNVCLNMLAQTIKFHLPS